MRPEDFRRIALTMPHAAEASHMNTPDFRVGGKIFATLYRQEKGLAMIKLTPAQQAEVVELDDGAFAPIPGGWGVKGATQVNLNAAKQSLVLRAMRIAWRNAAPARLLDGLILSPLKKESKEKQKSPAKRSPAKKSSPRSGKRR